MTCARRLAGARKPAPSAGSKRKPDPRPGRRRARFFLLLIPVLALLVGALGLFAAAPAQAQAPQLTGLTLTSAGGPAAGTSVTLSPTFAAGTTSYTATVPHGSTGLSVGATWTAANVSVVNSGSRDQDSSNIYTNREGNTITASGGTVSVNLAPGDADTYVDVVIRTTTIATSYTITVSKAPQPPAPTNLSVVPGRDAELAVSWTAPASSPAGFELDFTSAAVADVADGAAASGTNPAVAWVGTVANPSGTNTSYTIDSDDAALVNGRTYRVRLRGVTYSNTYAGGNSAWVFATGTTQPLTVSLSAPPTVDEGEQVFVRATLSRAAPSALTIPLTLTRDTSESGDHTSVTSLRISFGLHGQRAGDPDQPRQRR